MSSEGRILNHSGVLICEGESEEVSEEADKLLKAGEDVDLGNGKWDKMECASLMKKVTQWPIRHTLFLGKNNNAAMLVCIAHVRFPYLSRLALNHNHLCSLEALPRTYLPALTQLSLDNNHITNIRPITQCSCQLELLNLSDNAVLNGDELTKMQGQLVWLGLQILQSRPVGDVRWLVKLQSGKLRSLDLESRRSIKHPPAFTTTLKSKYKKLMM